jgi:hypothetical protein
MTAPVDRAKLGLIHRVMEDASVTEAQASLAIAMSYEHIAKGIDALSTEPTVTEIVAVLRKWAADLRIRDMDGLNVVLDATEDWT